MSRFEDASSFKSIVDRDNSVGRPFWAVIGFCAFACVVQTLKEVATERINHEEDTAVLEQMADDYDDSVRSAEDGDGEERIRKKPIEVQKVRATTNPLETQDVRRAYQKPGDTRVFASEGDHMRDELQKMIAEGKASNGVLLRDAPKVAKSLYRERD